MRRRRQDRALVERTSAVMVEKMLCERYLGSRMTIGKEYDNL